MNETWIRDFLALTETLNFSRAAQLRGITQPAFGRRIRALEDWCGQPLVDRTSHRLTLTSAGDLMQDAASDLLRRIERLRHDLETEERQSTALVFAATQALSFTFFPAWISRVGGGAAVHLLADNMRACERVMEAGRAQFLVCHLHPDMQLDLPAAHYRTRTIGHDRLVPVCAARDGRPVYSLAGADVPYLRFDGRSGLGRILTAAKGDNLAKLDLVPAFTSHVAMAIKPLMLDARGVAWLPLSLVEQDIAAGRCSLLDQAALVVDMSIAIVRPAQRMSRMAERFWADLRE